MNVEQLKKMQHEYVSLGFLEEIKKMEAFKRMGYYRMGIGEGFYSIEFKDGTEVILHDENEKELD